MKILLVSVSALLFVSITFASQVDLQDQVDQQESGEKFTIKDSEDENFEVNPISVNISTEELDVEPKKRSKKSYYPEPPCPYCAYNENEYGSHYDQRPAMEYNSNTQYRPNPGGNYYNSPPKPQYHAPQYYPPQYHGPQYHAPHQYHEPQYHASAPAAAYSQPTSYNAPNYQPPVYNSYNNYKHPAPAYPSGPSNFYPHQHRHNIPSSNLLVGCHPHVASVHDTGYTPHFVGSPLYIQPSDHNSASYRHHSVDDSSVSAPKGSDFSNKEMMPERITLLDNSQSNTNAVPVKDNSAKNEKSDTIQSANTFEEAKLQQHDTLFKMAQYQNQLSKNMATTTDEKQKKEPAAAGKKN